MDAAPPSQLALERSVSRFASNPKKEQQDDKVLVLKLQENGLFLLAGLLIEIVISPGRPVTIWMIGFAKKTDAPHISLECSFRKTQKQVADHTCCVVSVTRKWNSWFQKGALWLPRRLVALSLRLRITWDPRLSRQ